MLIDIAEDIIENTNIQKEFIISKHIESFIIWVETSYDWAMDKIIQFQKDLGIQSCEVISVNNIVFVFGPLKMEPAGEDSKKYKFTVSQDYAVFKKDEVLQSQSK